MILEIQIPDELYEKYKSYKPADPEAAITGQLKRFADVKPNDRIVVVDNQTRQRIEKLVGHIETAVDLENRLREALSLKVEGLDLVIDPDLLWHIEEQARFEGLERKEYMEKKFHEGISIAVRGYAE